MAHAEAAVPGDAPASVDPLGAAAPRDGRGLGLRPDSREALVGGFARGGRLDLLQHPRHDDQERGTQSIEGGDDRRRVGQVRDAHAAGQADQLKPARQHMGEGQEDDGVAVFVHDLAVRGGDVEHLTEEVPVGEHDSLGLARGARGVNDRRRIILGGGRSAGLDVLVGDADAARDQIGKGAGRLGIHRPRAERDGVRVRERLLQERRVLRGAADRQTHTGIRDDGVHLRRRGGLVDRHDDGAGEPGREVGDGPLVARGRHDRDRVACLDALGHEALRQSAHLVFETTRRDRSPRAGRRVFDLECT